MAREGGVAGKRGGGGGVQKFQKNVLIPKKQKCMGDVGEVSEKAGK